MSLRSIHRMTKVVATLGPACDAPETLGAMIDAGMNVARLNLSHGSHAEHAERIERVRRVARDHDANIAVMADTRGLEIRTAAVEGGEVRLAEGDAFSLFADARPGTREGVSVTHPKLPQEVQPGQSLLLDEGRLELRVDALDGDEIRCQVVRGGVLGSRKTVHVPGVRLSVEILGAESREDLEFSLQQDVDYVAASFVRSAEDVEKLRGFLAERGRALPIIAKIESRDGVRNLEEIVGVADGTMVARGDLGVEMAVEQVPLIQKRIIRSTVGAGKPVITATQMLDSMERNDRPTRAEASDVANAILDGTSAVMLSGETAMGLYPVESVRTMARLALEAEASLREYGDLQRILPTPARVVTEAVAQSAITMANHLDAAAILTLTESGFTSRSISKYRPRCPTLAVTTSREAMRRLALNWGITAALCDPEQDDDARLAFGLERARRLGFAEPGDVVVVTAGISREAGTTNLIRVVTA